MDQKRNPLDAALSAAFRRTAAPPSVLERIERETGAAPRVSLREEESLGAAAPLIDPSSPEKGALPRGRGTYQLLGEIARGGMGVVLKGHDCDLGRDVALKVLNEKYSDRPDVLQRFVEEAQIGGQLQHPGIVPVYELGLMADERPYFTMKLVKGQTLATLLAERMSPADDRRRLIDVFEAVCQTMAYAHSRGVIHRDLKPANVMVGAFGEVQVVDWGLAKVLARDAGGEKRDAPPVRTVLETVRTDGSGSGSDSLVGSVMGTPAYMPPEQAQGQVDRLDERTDVFALGAMLCELLTGRPPYESTTGEEEETVVQAAQARLDDAFARLDACDAPRELVELAKQCLAPARVARPRNAKVLAERIHRHLESVDEELQSARIEAAVQRRGRNLTLALAATILVAGGGWLRIQTDRAARERELAVEVNTALSEASILQGQGRWNEALAAVDRAIALAEAADESAELRASAARLGALRASVVAAAEQERVRIERERRAASFLAQLEEIGQTGSRESWIFDWPRIDEDYGRAFADFGVDVDGGAPDEVAAALAERGIGRELTPLLDRWLAVRRNREDRAGALRLVEIAHRVDDDPLRADLREAMLNDDVEMLTLLADGDLSGQPSSTLVLLGTALDFVERRSDALRILRQAARDDPGEFSVRTALAYVLRTRRAWTREDGLEARRQAEVALALRPGNYSVREYLFENLSGLARNSRMRGDEATALALHREAAAELATLYGDREELSAWETVYRGLAAEGVGDMEAALDDYLTFVEMRVDFEDTWLSQLVGIGLCLGGELEAAERCFERALEMDPEDHNDVLFLYNDRLFARVLRLIRAGEGDAAVAAMHAGVEEAPGDAVTQNLVRNNLAWGLARHSRAVLLAICRPGSPAETERMNRDLDRVLEEALEISSFAVEADGRQEMWNTLGAVLYRTGDDEGCLRAIAESMGRTFGGYPNNWIFVAFAHHRLGNEDQARVWYDRARRRWRNYGMDGPYWRQVLSLALEAEALFGEAGEGG